MVARTASDTATEADRRFRKSCRMGYPVVSWEFERAGLVPSCSAGGARKRGQRPRIDLRSPIAHASRRLHYLADIRQRELLEGGCVRSEEHTSELQSRQYLVCRLLLEK